MEILEIRTLRGPNYWSGYWKKLIIMRLDIADYEEKPTDKIAGFYDRLKDVLPSIATHGRFCGLNTEGSPRKQMAEWMHLCGCHTTVISPLS